MDGSIDHPHCQAQIAVVIDADLGDDVGRLAVADDLLSDYDLSLHGNEILLSKII
jgi:hypothetical protein